MKVVPNLGPAARVLYIAAGAALIAVALLMSLPPSRSWIIGIVGALIVVEGAVGF